LINNSAEIYFLEVARCAEIYFLEVARCTEMEIDMITSTSNSQVKYLVQLQNKTKIRKENKEFVVEGIKMVEEAPKDRIIKIYVSEHFVKANEETVNNFGVEYEIVSDNVFSQISDTKTPQGILAIVKMLDYSMNDLMNNIPLIAIIDNLQDPGNLGTIIRTGEGAGISGVLMSSNTVDIYNPKTIRSTMGSIFRVPFVYENDFLDAIDFIRNKNITIYAAHLDGKNSYTAEKYSGPSAFLIGNESNGLSEEAAKKADVLIRIPMCGKVESLNAAIATTVLLYEAKRQRDN